MTQPDVQETKTYFGESLEELLPQIREELGPDALIVRQREGIVGGIGGFFGRKVIEVEARPALLRPSMPARAIVDAYDTGDLTEADLDDLAAAAADEAPPQPSRHLLDTLLAQASPFAEHLAEVLEEVEAEAPMPVVAGVESALSEAEDVSMADLRSGPEPEPEPEPAPVVAPTAPRRRRAPAPAVAEAAPVTLDELAAIRRDLLAAAVPLRLAGEILGEVERSLRPFEPAVPVRELARRALARRIPIASGWTTKRRTIALVGLRGSGRTRAAAALCSAYVRDGRAVAAVSLESARSALELARLTAEDVPFHVADAPDLAARVRGLVRDAEVVIADTPPLADAIDGNRLVATLELLGALKPDETHLVLPATTSAEDGRTLVEALASHRLPSRLIVSHVDSPGAGGVPAGLAAGHRLPVSYVAGAASLRPADADALSRMVLL